VVEFVSREYQSTREPGLVGGGGLDVWTFKAVGAGETTITFGQYPPSNDPVDPEQAQTFTIVVK
jgi:predicted secreted protein